MPLSKRLLLIPVYACLGLLAACVSAKDPMVRQLHVAAVEKEAFAGSYQGSASRFSRVQGDTSSSKSLLSLLKDYCPELPAEQGLRSFSLRLDEALELRLQFESGELRVHRFEEGRDYRVENSVIVFSEKSHSGVIGDVAVGTATRQMRWFLDDKRQLVVVFGGQALTAVFCIVPLGVSGEGFAEFPRLP